MPVKKTFDVSGFLASLLSISNSNVAIHRHLCELFMYVIGAGSGNLKPLEEVLQFCQDHVDGTDNGGKTLLGVGQRLTMYCREFFGVTVESGEGDKISVTKNQASDVWSDPKKSLERMKNNPWYLWQQAKNIAKDWSDPYDRMVKAYAEGYLLASVTKESIASMFNEAFANAVVARSNDSKFRGMIQKRRGITTFPLDLLKEKAANEEKKEEEKAA